MDAAITNTGTEAKFVPGPNFNLNAGETKTWSDVVEADLDSNDAIKAAVVAGTLSVEMVPGPNDAAIATQGSLGPAGMPLYDYTDLPTGFNGRLAFVTNGRKGGEGIGAGTGVPCYYDAAATDWLTFSGDIAVTV